MTLQIENIVQNNLVFKKNVKIEKHITKIITLEYYEI